MTRVRLSDLGPGARAQIAAAVDQQTRPRRGKSRAGIGEAQPCRGHCHDCLAEFPSFTKWLRHAQTAHAGNGRWDIDLDPQDPQ